MSSSNQKLVQAYLGRHGIGKLFEDMMASLIKEMPNEPFLFLVKILQRRFKKQQNVDSPLSPPSRRGMGLTGSSIPKKSTDDPQVVLPGSKAVTSSYGKVSADTESLFSEDNVRVSKDRDYNKQWKSNVKGGKSSKSKKDNAWDGETKVHGVDDIFEQNQSNNPLSKSLPVPGNVSKKDQLNWTSPSNTKKVKKDITQPSVITGETLHRTTALSDEEIMINNNNNNNNVPNSEGNRRKTFSPHGYSKVKRHSSKKKANMQKQKLQELLSSDSTTATTTSSSAGSTNVGDDDSTDDDDAVDILENMADLECEGVTSRSNGSGYKHCSQRSSSSTLSSNVTVSMCSRCAKILGNENSTVVSSLQREDSYNSDIESISQIDASKPFRPKWPVISDSDDETQVTSDRKPTKSNLSRSSFKSLGDEKPVKSVKSDFFDGNSPLRKKTKQFANPLLSDDESNATFLATSTKENILFEDSRRSSPLSKSLHKKTNRKSTNPPVSALRTSGGKQQAWKQQDFVDSNSDDEIISSISKGNKRPTSVGFKLKEATDDGDSDLL